MNQATRMRVHLSREPCHCFCLSRRLPATRKKKIREKKRNKLMHESLKYCLCFYLSRRLPATHAVNQLQNVYQ
jgi:hypothetical protein